MKPEKYNPIEPGSTPMEDTPKEFDRYQGDFSTEKGDPAVAERPLGWDRPMSIQEMIATYVRSEVAMARIGGVPHESWEEANDFDIDDDSPLPRSQHEVYELQEEFYQKDRQAHYKAERKKKSVKNWPKPPETPQSEGVASPQKAGDGQPPPAAKNPPAKAV